MLCILNSEKGHNWGGDFALYIHQAKSITEGTSNQLSIANKYIVENSSVHTFSPTLYPWGFPILIAPIYAMYNLDYIALKILEALFLVCGIIMMYLTFRKEDILNQKNSLFFVAIIGFNIQYIQATNNVLSEMPFLLFSFISLYLILKLLRNPYKNPWIQSVCLGVILFFSFSIRTEGIGLLMALCVGQLHYVFINRKKQALSDPKHLLFFVPYITTLLSYYILKLVLPSGFTSHFSYNTLISWDTSMLNLDLYFKWIKDTMFGDLAIPYLLPTILLIAVVGMGYRIKKDVVLLTYLLFLLVLFTVWPFRELRYLYAIYPFILYFLIQGLQFLFKLSKENIFAKYAALFILCLCLSTNLIKTYEATFKALNNPSQLAFGPEAPESKEMFAYIKTNTQNEDVIGFFRPRVMHLYTNRVSLALFNSTTEILEKSNYYVENKAAGNFFQIPLEHNINSGSDHVKKVFSNGTFNIYKIITHD